MSEQRTFDLDRRHKLLHEEPNRWAVQQIRPDGKYDTIATWTGGQRSVRNWCDEHGVTPAEATARWLESVPETGGFKDR